MASRFVANSRALNPNLTIFWTCQDFHRIGQNVFQSLSDQDSVSVILLYSCYTERAAIHCDCVLANGSIGTDGLLSGIAWVVFYKGYLNDLDLLRFGGHHDLYTSSRH